MQKKKKELTKTTPKEEVLIPDVDIYETEEAYVLLADLPGVDRDNLCVDIKEDELIIDGRVENVFKEGERPLAEEFKLGRYYRKFALGDLINYENVQASLKNGVLKVVLGKAEAAKPKKIEVKVAE